MYYNNIRINVLYTLKEQPPRLDRDVLCYTRDLTFRNIYNTPRGCGPSIKYNQ